MLTLLTARSYLEALMRLGNSPLGFIALKALRPSLMRYDYIHFVTSAYQQLYTAFIDRIDTALLLALQGRDVALGHIDAYNTPVRIWPHHAGLAPVFLRVRAACDIAPPRADGKPTRSHHVVLQRSGLAVSRGCAPLAGFPLPHHPVADRRGNRTRLGLAFALRTKLRHAWSFRGQGPRNPQRALAVAASSDPRHRNGGRHMDGRHTETKPLASAATA